MSSAGIIELELGGRGPKRGYVFDPHRLALPCWAQRQGPSLLRRGVIRLRVRHWAGRMDIVFLYHSEMPPDAAHAFQHVQAGPEFARSESSGGTFPILNNSLQIGAHKST